MSPSQIVAPIFILLIMITVLFLVVIDTACPSKTTETIKCISKYQNDTKEGAQFTIVFEYMASGKVAVTSKSVPFSLYNKIEIGKVYECDITQSLILLTRISIDDVRPKDNRPSNVTLPQNK